MKLALIVAHAHDRVIGRDNALPWRLPEDLAQFKRVTLGHPVVMGRRTWESIGRPLPGRRNVVVTRDPGWRADGAEPASSLDAALALIGDAPLAFVIGGAQLYASALPVADAVHVTEIDLDVAGDTFFPPLDAAAWFEASREPRVAADGTRFAFVRFERRPGSAG